ncbi:hypothetical protein ACSHT0_16545 [Tepidicaulis sp. LMO-SS28]|uniref:hypothetical protein n=1 Tax=Tepidicaulis sp. LMO-SS28 TaxID=3447455 RepID=UPI003EE27B6D
MSDLNTAAVAALQAQTRAQMATVMQKQQIDAERTVVSMIAQLVQAATPEGVGETVDVTA